MKTNLNNSIIMITGGTGSWGRELVTQILEKYSPKQIRIYSRGEHTQVEMRRRYPDPRLKFIIGDVRDKNILGLAMKNVDYVFHLAALKHVHVCEEACWEAVLTNIFGTQNVIEAAMENKVKMVVDASTDKAVEPFNLYGITKACGERLMINANQNYITDTKFVCIRGGNVLGTAGSVIPLFKKQILEDNAITLTDPKMTRFLMSAREAIGLVLEAVEGAIGGETFVMKMPASGMDVLMKTMIKMFGNKDTKIKIIGRRPGEKMHEVLISNNEMPFMRDLSNGYFVILPQFAGMLHQKRYGKFPKKTFEEFSSQNTRQLTGEKLEVMLKQEKWLFADNKISVRD